MRGRVAVVYAGEEPPETFEGSVFLCGPTPRSGEVTSWRPAALEQLRRRWCGDGLLVVFVPEPRDGTRWPTYDDNRTWELHWGDRADVTLFWIPRGPGMEGRTTNDEFGRWKDSGRAVLGTPPEAQHVRYQRDYATEHGIPLADTLDATVDLALALIGTGAQRSGGHRHVPLLLWRTVSFQRWLDAQRGAGNELRSGRVAWVLRTGSDRSVFLWAFHAAMWVAAEQREKANEVVLARPDLSGVVAYHRAERFEDCEVLLVREFRTASVSSDGFVRELPSGSGPSQQSAKEVAVAELAEETGIVVEIGRVRTHGARQLVPTLSAHRQHAFSVELTSDELAAARADSTVHGEAGSSERTYVEVRTFGEMLASEDIDWATLGVVCLVLHERMRTEEGGGHVEFNPP